MIRHDSQHLTRCLAMVSVLIAALSAPSATAQARCTLPLEVNSDRYGSDYKNFPTGDAEACCLACERDPACRSYAWYSPKQSCYLKSTAPAKVVAPGLTSGAKPAVVPQPPAPVPVPVPAQGGGRCGLPLEPNTDRYGSDFQNIPSTTTAEACCLACERNEKCRSYAWHAAGQTCYLKSTVPAKVAGPGLTSGAKASAVATPVAPVAGQHYAVVNYTGDVKNPHDFIVDWDACKVSELNQEFSAGKEDIKISVCRPRSRLVMRTDFRTTGYWIQYDWVFLDNGTTVAGSYRDPGSCGPSAGKLVP